MKINIPPQAAGTVRALSQIGYSPETAICDLLDNSIQAGASSIDLFINLEENWITIRDNGSGMKDQQIIDAFTYGKKTDGSKSLGKFGMGLKTASTSLGGKVSVFSATTIEGDTIEFSGTFVLDIGSIERENKWEIERVETDPDHKKRFIKRHNQIAPPEGSNCTGTMLRIEKLNNLLGKEYQDKTAKPFEKATKDFVAGLRKHLGKTYFHFLKDGIKIAVDGKFVEGTNLLDGGELLWETSYSLPGVKHEEDLPVRIYRTTEDTGIFIFRERRLIEAGKTGFGIKKDSNIAVVFEFTENLDNILEVDLQKSKIERLKLDADIIETIERKIKEITKEAKAQTPEPQGSSTNDADATNVTSPETGNEQPKMEDPEEEMEESRAGDTWTEEQDEELDTSVEPDASIDPQSVEVTNLEESPESPESPESVAPSTDASVPSLREVCQTLLDSCPESKLPEIETFLKSLQ